MTTELTPRALAVRDLTRDLAADLRARALAVDAAPDAMDAHLGSAAFAVIRQAETPPEYREQTAGDPAALLDARSCLESAVGQLELAYGDFGTLLACPAPGLAGVFVRMFGSPAQQSQFFGRLRDGRTWTFFAMTEPAHGSDATAIETRLDRVGDGGYALTGRKRYIGNGARGAIGVVFGRTGPSVLSIRAALVQLPSAGCQATRLDMVGLRGAGLGEMTFCGLPVAVDGLLGEHLSATRRGLRAAVDTFNQMRVRVAAAAAGTTLAIVDYVAEQHKSARGLELAAAHARAARELVCQAAVRIDHDPGQGYLSSAAKLSATTTAVKTARWASAALGPGGLLEHPLLEKWVRDVHAFEFMEGAGNIQRQQVARGYHAGAAEVAQSAEVFDA
jgi:alkylation response protein AidB-like acyl-CoA dehydrogenase